MDTLGKPHARAIWRFAETCTWRWRIIFSNETNELRRFRRSASCAYSICAASEIATMFPLRTSRTYSVSYAHRRLPVCLLSNIEARGHSRIGLRDQIRRRAFTARKAYLR